MTKAIAALTIGQAPRPDLVAELRRVLGPTIDIVERGALDGLSLVEVERLCPEPHAAPLLTRMTDGRTAVVDESFVAARVQMLLDEVGPHVGLVALLCTGDFLHLQSCCPVLLPDRVLSSFVAAVAPARLGVLVPLEAQRSALLARWSRRVPHAQVEVASPYGEREAVVEAAQHLGVDRPDLIVLDCIGYTAELKELVRQTAGCPVVQASSALAHVAAELLS
jgi:protein AroM